MTIKEVFENIRHNKGSMAKLAFIKFYIDFLNTFFESDESKKLELITEKPIRYINIPENIYVNCAEKIKDLAINNKIKVPDWALYQDFKNNKIISLKYYKLKHLRKGVF